MYANQKCAFFHFNIPRSYQICLAKCLYSPTDDLDDNMGKFAAQERKTSEKGNTGIPSYKGVLSTDVTVAAEIHRVTKNYPRTLKINKQTNKQTKNKYVHKYTGNMAQVSAFYLFSLYVKMKQSTADCIFAERWSCLNHKLYLFFCLDHHYFSRRAK